MKKLNEVINENKSPKSIMEHLYGILSNSHELQSIDEASVNRLFSKHHPNGFLILSANRSDVDSKTNKDNHKGLLKDIREFGASYFPVYGGYKGTDGVVDEYEPSVVVTAFNKNKEIIDFEDLKKFGLKMCGKYDQNSILVVEPNGKPTYMDRNGEVIGKEGDAPVKFNDLGQEYFTAIKKAKPSKTFKGSTDKNDRFTLDMQFEYFALPSPTTLTERMQRKSYGEILNID